MYHMYVISFVYLCGFTQIYSHVSCLDMYGHVYLPFIIFTHTHIYIYIYIHTETCIHDCFNGFC